MNHTNSTEIREKKEIYPFLNELSFYLKVKKKILLDPILVDSSSRNDE